MFSAFQKFIVNEEGHQPFTKRSKAKDEKIDHNFSDILSHKNHRNFFLTGYLMRLLSIH